MKGSSKDYGYRKESANKVIEKGVKENMVRIVFFNGKNSYRIVENEENTVFVPETQLNDTDATEAISEKGNALAIEETVSTPAYILNNQIISTLERRLFNIEEQIIGARDSHIDKIGDDNPDNAFCFNLLKNCISELERQIIEKDVIIIFLSNQLVNKYLYGDSRVNKTVNDHINRFQGRVDNIVNNDLPMVQHTDYNKNRVK